MAEKNYLWRGGEKIAVEKEPQYFTTIITEKNSLRKISALPGVEEIKPVITGVYKVRANPESIDEIMAVVRSAPIDEVAHHAYNPVGDASTRYYLTNRITVKFKENTTIKQIEKIMRDHGIKLLREYGTDSKTYLFEVTDTAGENPLKVTNKLAKLKEVVYAEPDLINRFQPFYTPADTLFAEQWHLKSRNDVELVAGADVAAPDAWEHGRGNRNVVVAVIDDGFDISHPDLSGNGKIVFPKDYVDGDTEPFPTKAHVDYHGTPCAGVAIAEENGTGVLGAAPGCAFQPIRFDLSADDNLLWDIFDYAAQHADVISCSWGPVPVYAPLSSLLTEKFHEIAESGGPRGKGTLIMFAAGNYNAPINDPDNQGFTWRHPTVGNRVTTGPILNGNCAHPDVVAVAASTSQNRKAAYSNWGKEISVCSPSNNFHPLNPDELVPGRGIWTTDNEAQGYGFTNNSRYTGDFGGTSSATPLVAGVAALVISANSDLTAKEVKQILEETADKITDNQPDPVLENTKGTYDNTGHSEWFGYGKVNAAKAVQKALTLKGDPDTTLTILKPVAETNSKLTASGSEKVFKIAIGNKLSVRLTGPAGKDFDLYLKKDDIPTISSYDKRGYTQSANEQVIFENATPGIYYVMVRSYSGTGDFTLKAELE